MASWCGDLDECINLGVHFRFSIDSAPPIGRPVDRLPDG
jgi:hypothetical protein